jgi:hypothetical protein
MGFPPETPESHAALPLLLAPPTVPEAGSDQALARMVSRMTKGSSRFSAEAPRQLRAAFSDSPLALRVAALGMAMRRHRAGRPAF